MLSSVGLHTDRHGRSWWVRGHSVSDYYLAMVASEPSFRFIKTTRDGCKLEVGHGGHCMFVQANIFPHLLPLRLVCGERCDMETSWTSLSTNDQKDERQLVVVDFNVVSNSSNLPMGVSHRPPVKYAFCAVTK